MAPLEPKPEIGDLWQHHKRHDEKCIILNVHETDQHSPLVDVFWLHAFYRATVYMLTIRTAYVRVASAEKSLDQK